MNHEGDHPNRRRFLARSLAVSGAAGLAGLSLEEQALVARAQSEVLDQDQQPAVKGPPEGFRLALSMGADFLNVGMFDFQVRENAALMKDLLAGDLPRHRNSLY